MNLPTSSSLKSSLQSSLARPWQRGARALRGLSALGKLLKDPDDLPQVFRVIEGFGDASVLRNVAELRRSVNGRALLANKPDIVPRLADRAALSALPDGTLGRAYLAFVESENLSADGLIAASEGGDVVELEHPDVTWQKQRMRDTHDLWHALTGYQGDVLGEASLLGFLYAQTNAPAIGLMVAAAFLKLRTRAARHTIVDGYQRGKRSAWLLDVQWEALLERPLEEVRTLLHIDAPPVYTPLRTADLRAAEALAA